MQTPAGLIACTSINRLWNVFTHMYIISGKLKPNPPEQKHQHVTCPVPNLLHLMHNKDALIMGCPPFENLTQVTGNTMEALIYLIPTSCTTHVCSGSRSDGFWNTKYMLCRPFTIVITLPKKHTGPEYCNQTEDLAALNLPDKLVMHLNTSRRTRGILSGICRY
jgi:hypothetical protein